MNMRKILLLLAIVLTCVVMSAFNVIQDKPWVVPEASKKQRNPMKATEENINVGKNLYSKHCRSCHGKNGEGDGPKAGELKTSPGDFTTLDFQQQTDGELYYKTTEGRDDMPGFRKKLSNDEDRWVIVAYLRTLKPA
jgi:mono/diheme cytochrome c family protein